MHIEYRKSIALPVLNSFFVTDFDAMFNTIISLADSGHYKFDRKTQTYEVDKELMKTYFDRTGKDPDTHIIDQRVEVPDKPELVSDDGENKFKYQQLAGEYMSTRNDCLLFFDTGTGKTRTTINALNELKPHKTLVILGKSALAPVWEKELLECLIDVNKKVILNASLKSTKDKIQDFETAKIAVSDTLVLMNVEGARIPAIQKAINDYQPDVVIIDECQVIKGSKSLQTQGAFEIESKYRWALSATPVINNPLEWYSLLKWLRVHNSAKSRFDKYYGNWEHDFWGHYVCTGYKNEDDLQQMVDFVSIRFKKVSIGLPPLNEHPRITLPLTDAEQDVYNQLMEMKRTPFLRTKYLTDGTPIENQAALFAYQRFFVSTIHSKVEMINSLAKEKPLIVVSMLVKPLNKLQTQVKNSAVYSGEQSAEERQQVLDDFRSGKIRVLLLSLKAGGVGLTLTTSWTILFIDAPNSQAEYEQARDRVHRISQTRPVDVLKLLGEGTHDEFAWDNMNTKFGWISLYYKGDINETV